MGGITKFLDYEGEAYKESYKFLKPASNMSEEEIKKRILLFRHNDFYLSKDSSGK